MIRSLSYVGFTSPRADEWRSFAPEVLGAQVAVDGADGAVRLRVDQAEARLVIHPGSRDDVAYFGWDTGDAAGLRAAAARVEAAGLAVAADVDARVARRVADLVTFVDPFGFRHELTHGLGDGGPFVPGRPLRGRFVTGDGGLGHVVLFVPDLQAGLDFFTGTLGFLVSDHVEMGVSLRFLHCNPRHHTVAIAQVPGMAGLHHLMLEVDSIDDVGAALDLVNERGMTLAMTLGRHPNDLMTSFYVRTPSGFEIEYGTGGRLIDDADWTVETYDHQSIWGHKPPASRLVPGIIRPVTASGARS